MSQCRPCTAKGPRSRIHRQLFGPELAGSRSRATSAASAFVCARVMVALARMSESARAGSAAGISDLFLSELARVCDSVEKSPALRGLDVAFPSHFVMVAKVSCRDLKSEPARADSDIRARTTITVCMCVCARARACVCVRVRVRVFVCVHARARACE